MANYVAPHKIAPEDKPQTIYIAKAIHYASAAAAMFETLIIEARLQGYSKALMQEQARRCRLAVQAVTTRLKTGEAKETIAAEMKDEYWLDSMFSGMLSLNEAGREAMEECLAALMRGEQPIFQQNTSTK